MNIKKWLNNNCKETPEEINEFKVIEKRYDCKFDLEGKHTYEPVGCEKCNKTGFYDRIAAIEILTLDDNLKDLIIADRPANEIRRAAFESGYRPLVVDAFNKVLQGTTTIGEVRNKLAY